MTKAGPVSLEVLSPISKIAITHKNAARLDTLQGKKICEVWVTGGWRGNVTFQVIRELLQKRFPEAKIVPYTESPLGQDYPEKRQWIPMDKALQEWVGQKLKEAECDAVLLGNGG